MRMRKHYDSKKSVEIVIEEAQFQLGSNGRLHSGVGLHEAIPFSRDRQCLAFVVLEKINIALLRRRACQIPTMTVSPVVEIAVGWPGALARGGGAIATTWPLLATLQPPFSACKTVNQFHCGDNLNSCLDLQVKQPVLVRSLAFGIFDTVKPQSCSLETTVPYYARRNPIPFEDLQ
jgi:hypothetical protein